MFSPWPDTCPAGLDLAPNRAYDDHWNVCSSTRDGSGAESTVRTILLLGTKKGVFLAERDGRRADWTMRGPLTSGTWSMYSTGFGQSLDVDRPTIYAGGASNWYGPAVWKSQDWGQTWTHSSEGLTYGDEGPEISQIWCVTAAHGFLYCGVEPAGLFRSADGGASWEHVAALREHPSCSAWRPTNGGLCLHAIVSHPADPQQMWVAISSGGVFYTADGGHSWERQAAVAQTGGAPSPDTHELHPCAHALSMTLLADGARDTPRLYQQSHDGVYRSDDGGQTWKDVSGGLPSRFGFALAVHPRDPQTLYVVPLENDGSGSRHMPEDNPAVWRSRDAGAHWQALSNGFPKGRASISVLRGALALDSLDPAGVYLGTTTGQVYWSVDEGETWQSLPARLPPIYSVAALAI